MAEVSRKPHNAAQGGVRGGNHPNTGAFANNSGTGVNNGTAGFGNQVDSAFDTNKNMTSGLTNGSTNGNAANTANNPTYYEGVTSH